MTKLVIVIPCFNEEATIEITLNKIHNQVSKYQEFEFQILVLDDSSTDESFAKLLELKSKSFPKLKIIANKTNLGIAVSTKILIAEAIKLNSDYVIKCDMDDDFPHEKVISIFLSYIIDYNINHNQILIGERQIEDENLMSSLELNEKVKMKKYLSVNLNIDDYNPVSSGVLMYGKEVIRTIINLKTVQEYNLRWGLDFLLPLIAHKKGFKIIKLKIDNGSYSVSRRPESKILEQYASYYQILNLLTTNY